jgi:hypothetical protein
MSCIAAMKGRKDCYNDETKNRWSMIYPLIETQIEEKESERMIRATLSQLMIPCESKYIPHTLSNKASLHKSTQIVHPLKDEEAKKE